MMKIKVIILALMVGFPLDKVSAGHTQSCVVCVGEKCNNKLEEKVEDCEAGVKFCMLKMSFREDGSHLILRGCSLTNNEDECGFIEFGDVYGCFDPQQESSQKVMLECMNEREVGSEVTIHLPSRFYNKVCYCKEERCDTDEDEEGPTAKSLKEGGGDASSDKDESVSLRASIGLLVFAVIFANCFKD